MKTRSLAIITLFCLGVVLKGYPQQFGGFVMSGVTPDKASLNEAVNLMNSDDAEINQMIAQSPLEKTTYDNFVKKISSHVATVDQLYGKYLKSLGLAANNQQTVEFEQRMANVYAKSQKVTCKNPDGTISTTSNPSSFTPAASNASIGNNNTFTPTVNYAANDVLKKSDDYENEYGNKNIKLTADNSAAAQSENTVKNVTNVSDLNFDNVNIPVTNATPTTITNIANNSGTNTSVTASTSTNGASNINENISNAASDQTGGTPTISNVSERQQAFFTENDAHNQTFNNDQPSLQQVTNYFDSPTNSSDNNTDGEKVVPPSVAKAGEAYINAANPDDNVSKFINYNAKNIINITNDAGQAVSALGNENNIDYSGKISDDINQWANGTTKQFDNVVQRADHLFDSSVSAIRSVAQYATDHPGIATGSVVIAAVVFTPAVAGAVVLGTGGTFLLAKRFLTQ